MITVKEYAAKKGVSKQWINRMLQQDRIPGAEYKYGLWLIPPNAKIIRPTSKQ